MRIGVLCVAGLGLLLAGCGGVLSDAPLSDASSSVVDERLIGAWELVPGGPSDAAKDKPRVYVGRLEGSDSVLEAVTIKLDTDQRIDVRRYRIFQTRIGDASFLSVTDEKERVYMLLRYGLDGDGRLRLQHLDEEKAAGDIRAKKIAGRVKDHPKEKAGPLDVRVGHYEEVRLTADTEALRVWVEQNPDVWIPLKTDVAHLRKLVFKTEAKSK